MLRQRQPAYETLSFAAGRAVAYGNHLNGIFLHHIGYLLHGGNTLVYRRMRVYGIVVKQIALSVQADHLASCTEARIYGHHPLLPNRRGEQKLAQILAEDLDGAYVGLLFSNLEHLIFNRGMKQTLETVGHCVAQNIIKFTRGRQALSLRCAPGCGRHPHPP